MRRADTANSNGATWTGSIAAALSMAFSMPRKSSVAVDEEKFQRSIFADVLKATFSNDGPLRVSLIAAESTPQRFRFEVEVSGEDCIKATVPYPGSLDISTFTLDAYVSPEDRRLIVIALITELSRIVELSQDGFQIEPADRSFVARLLQDYDLHASEEGVSDELPARVM